MKIRIEESTFKGRPIISLYDDEATGDNKRYPLLTMGLRKAKAVCLTINNIDTFIKKHEGEKWRNT